jgi:uncharacterized LabA/DUF88 family protein
VSKNVAMFVDVANLYYSARGQDVDVDYVALLKAATKGRDLIRAYAYSGLDPDNENQRKFIDFLGKNGYKVLTKDIRKFGDGRVKANLDIEIVVDLLRLADRMDIAVVVSGDGDFAPAIRAVQEKGVRCEVISFRPNTSSDLIAVADEFIDIMKIAGIGRNSKEAKEQRGMSAPEMPAKEVVPEFGFREASPGVAKAALAAIREGKPGNGSERGRRRSRSTAAAKADEPAETTVPETEASPAAAEEANGDDQQRRRRRRRGGRGRGRSRSRTAVEASEGQPAEGGETGWVELDDISQISELEGGVLDDEREYTFEEADEATLAELGIAPLAPAPVTEHPKKPARRSRGTKAGGAETQAEASTEEPKKPARRSRARKADTAETAPEASTEEPKKPARRPRTRKADTAETAPEEPKKPARRPRTRKAEESASNESASQDQEGIWQRFRTARGTRKPS